MPNYKQVAQQLIAAMKETAYVVSAGMAEGLSVMAYANTEELIFSYNLGGFYVPTKAVAKEMLFKLQRHYEALRVAGDLEWEAYFEGKSFQAEVIVFSGQMDFPVCTLKNGNIAWYTNLKDE